MSAQLQSELRKLSTTRTTAVLLLAAVALAAFGAISEGFFGAHDALGHGDEQRMLLGQVTSIATFFATLAGVLAVTSEHRYGTIRSTLVFEPRRHVVLAAKLTVAALAGVLFAAACVAVAVGVGLAVVAVRDIGVSLSAGDISVLVLGPFVAGPLSAAIGVAIGTLVRNQVGAIVAFFAYGLLFDALLFRAVPSIGRFLPGQAGNALVGQLDDHLLIPAVAAAVLVGWTLVFAAAALGRDECTDV